MVKLHAVQTNDASLLAGSAFRLPRTVVPTRYDLTLSPDLAQQDYVGSVTVALTIDPTVVNLVEIVANAIDLDILRAYVVDENGARIDAKATLDSETERVHFALSHPLTGSSAELHVDFHGKISKELRGFYASNYTAEDGTAKIIATTQFESTDARRCFPCWDEPDLKATFGVTLIVDDGLLAVTNGPAISEDRTASGKRRIRFADTMVMSTYLVAFIVGDLAATEPVDVDGVPVRVISRKGREHLTSFALDAAAFALRHFISYFAQPYPDRKLDLIAIPDFAFGAMENVGAVTFRETLLLVDPETASRNEQEVAIDVIAHEIAHMWFGNLVTMRWWNGLWLNEAFATFAEMSCTNAYKPEWKRWDGFAQMRASALAVDALHSTRPIEFPVVSPSDAEGMFDVLTYEKGAGVLRMLEQHVGEDKFRDGVRRYLRTHAHANTDISDLWDALEAETGIPVGTIMDSWILQGGHPVVEVSAGTTPTTVVLTQSPFTTLPEPPPTQALAQSERATTASTRWQIPVRLRTIDRPALPTGTASPTVAGAVGSKPVTALVLADTMQQVDIGRPRSEVAVCANAFGAAVYRIRTRGEVRDALLTTLTDFAPSERFAVVFDSWGDTLSGSASLKDHLQIVRALMERGATETDPNVWSVLAATCDAISRLLTSEPDQAPTRAQFAQFVRSLVDPARATLGAVARADDGPFDGQLRAVLLRAAVVYGGDEAARHDAETLLRAHLDGAAGDPDLLPTLTSLAADTGDATLYERYLEARRKAPTPQTEQRWLRGLSDFRPPELVQRTLELSLDEAVRPADAPFLLFRSLSHSVHGPVAWTFLRDHWAAVTARLTNSLLIRTLGGIIQLDAVSPDVVSFLSGVEFAGSHRRVAQNLEQLQAWGSFVARERPRLAESLT